MKDWNVTAWIKTGIILLLSLHYAFFPISTTGIGQPSDFIVPFVIEVLIVPIGIKLSFFKIIIEKPHWNDNPFRLRRFLIVVQFISIMAVTFGMVSILSGAILYATIDSLALTMLGSGLGLYLGMLVTLWLSTRKQHKR